MAGQIVLSWSMQEAYIKAYRSFDGRLNDTYVWIEEAIAEAKKTFETYSSSLYLFFNFEFCFIFLQTTSQSHIFSTLFNVPIYSTGWRTMLYRLLFSDAYAVFCYFLETCEYNLTVVKLLGSKKSNLRCHIPGIQLPNLIDSYESLGNEFSGCA